MTNIQEICAYHMTAQDVAPKIGCKPAHVRVLFKRGLIGGYSISPPGSRAPRIRHTDEHVEDFQAGKPPRNTSVLVPASPKPKRVSKAKPADDEDDDEAWMDAHKKGA